MPTAQSSCDSVPATQGSPVPKKRHGKRGAYQAPTRGRPSSPKTKLVVDAKRDLAIFFANNPLASCDARRLPSGDHEVLINKPWGDSSLAIRLPSAPDPDAVALVAALNDLVLPERLTAVWHVDTKRLEIIWTAFKLPAVWQEVQDRKFEFEYAGNIHTCRFDRSSDRLILLGKHYAAQFDSSTNFRNLHAYWLYAHFQESARRVFNVEKPLSFWIDNIEWNEIDTIVLLEHLNFYLTYYDRRGPWIILHTPAAEPVLAERTRYLQGPFPDRIVARPLDGSLLSFWVSAVAGNPMLAFILYYRILEYAAFNFVDYEVRGNIRKLLSAPNLSGESLDHIIAQIMDFIALKSIDDIQKFRRVIKINVDPKLLWRDVQANIGVLSSDMEFDGGFVMKRLIPPNETERGFCERGIDAFTDSIRVLRNTISHGKNQETAGVVAATARNVQLLRPWQHLIATAAGEVVLYKDVT
jgi:hypothetical protein